MAYSKRGVGLATDDPTIIPTLRWIAQRRMCQESSVVQENVKGCPPTLFQEFLGDIYWLEES